MKTKFRAWDKKEKRFIQHVHLNDDGSVSFLNSKALWQFDENERIIIQFFIGLKDDTRTHEFPKGKEICVGDKIQVDEYYIGDHLQNPFIGEVRYSNESYEVADSENAACEQLDRESIFNYSMKVVGNIFER